MKVLGWTGAAAVCLLTARMAAAQTVRGTLIGQDGATVVAGGIVQLVDSANKIAGQTLSRSDGSFVLAAPGPGGYRLRGLRIGYTPTLSAPFTLAAAEDRPVRLVLTGQAVVLAPVAVRADRRCAVDPDSGSEAARLWGEVRKALTATVLSQSRSYWARLATYTESRTDRDARPAADRTQHELEGMSPHPFATVAADTLARYGFVRGDARSGMTFFGADAALLIADGFAATHCLRLESGEAAPDRHGDWIGLGFEPVRTAKPDIRGTLWVDRRSAELRQLDYTYTGISRAAMDARAGGSTEFLRLGDGAWLVRRWSIRMPLLTIRLGSGGFATRFGYSGGEEPRPDTIVRTVQITGGELLDLRMATGEDWRGRSNAVRGTVVDRATGAPRAGIPVSLDGTSRVATTDSSGAFAFESLLPGRYVVRAGAVGPGANGAMATVDVPDSGEVDTRVRLVAPPSATTAGPATPMAVAPPGPRGASATRSLAVLTVRVSDARTGAPVRAAEVSLPGHSRVGLTDSAGTLRISNVPEGSYRVRLRRLGYAPVDTAVLVQGDTVRRDFALVHQPPMLDTVAVEESGVPDYLRDFESRRSRGAGVFLTEDQLQRRAHERFATVAVTSIPGLRLVHDAAEHPQLASTRGSCGYEDPEGGGSSSSSCFSVTPCLVRILLDGERLPDGQLELVRTDELAAVEYYSGSNIPVRYREAGTACGVMLLWSRR